MAPMIFTYSLASLSLLLPVLTPCRGLVPSGTRRAVCRSLLSGVYASDGHRSAVAHRRPSSAPNPGCHLPARSAASALLPVLTPCRGLVPSGARRVVGRSLLSGVYASDGYRSAAAHRHPSSAPNSGCHLPARSAASALLASSVLRFPPCRMGWRSRSRGARRSEPGGGKPSQPARPSCGACEISRPRQLGPPSASPPRAHFPIGYGWS